MAVRRAEKEKILTFKIEIPEDRALLVLQNYFVKSKKADGVQVMEACMDSFKRLIAPSLETEIRIEMKKRADAQGFISVVVFEPSDVDMFNKSPEVRRKYLNMVLSQKNPEYLENISNYKKIIYQKTRLLQDAKGKNIPPEGIEAWNEQLVDLGSAIVEERKNFLNHLNNNIAEVYTTISGFHRPVEVAYKGLEGESRQDIAQDFRDRLEKYRHKEHLLATCMVGPHKDDFFLKSEGLFLPPFSSRGELRSQILALKILELEYLSKGEEKPILLLDDVLSELDETRKDFLLKYLQGRFQTFITTTQTLDIPAQHITLSPSEEAEPVEMAEE
jgi:DNA replication and repair protein RecF